MDYNARYYSPFLGRFISADTMVPEEENPQHWNRYSYTYNNPLKFVDPTGHCGEVFMTEDGEIIEDPCEGGGTAAGMVPSGGGSQGGGTVASKVIPYLYSAHATLSNISAAHPVAAAAVGGVAETAVECGLAGNCNTGDYVMGALTGGLSKAGGAPCSFSANTLVATDEGLIPIGEVIGGKIVLAYNEVTGELGYYPVEAVWAHTDPVIVYLVIEGERIETTPEHPFYTSEAEWIAAGELRLGDLIRQASGRYGRVQAVEFVSQPEVMYNLTVAEAHTYFVGVGRWLVHNAKCRNPYGKPGSPTHKAKVEEIQGDLNVLYADDPNVTIQTEYRVPTPYGRKKYRDVDVAAIDATTGEPVSLHQVGVAEGGLPVLRELQAMDDIQMATNRRPQFHPYKEK
jgi:hypothetical protein